MRSRMYHIFQLMNNICNTWDARGVEDATAEPEWEDYEGFLYVTAEWLCGDRTFHGQWR